MCLPLLLLFDCTFNIYVQVWYCGMYQGNSIPTGWFLSVVSNTALKFEGWHVQRISSIQFTWLMHVNVNRNYPLSKWAPSHTFMTTVEPWCRNPSTHFWEIDSDNKPYTKILVSNEYIKAGHTKSMTRHWSNDVMTMTWDPWSQNKYD